MPTPNGLARFLEVTNRLERRIFAMRRDLFHQMRREQLRTSDLHLLVCRVGTDRVGVAFDCVESAVLACELAPLAGAPAWVPGLLNFRGAVLPVVDLLAATLGQARRPTLGDSILVCQTDGHRLGLLVQGVSTVCRAAADDLQTHTDTAARADFIMGVALVDDEPVWLLSVRQVLASAGLPRLPEGET
jgi:chemotaxis signal transduction protein